MTTTGHILSHFSFSCHLTAREYELVDLGELDFCRLESRGCSNTESPLILTNRGTKRDCKAKQVEDISVNHDSSCVTRDSLPPQTIGKSQIKKEYRMFTCQGGFTSQVFIISKKHRSAIQ